MHQQIFSDATSTLHSQKVLAAHTMVTPWGNKGVAWKTNIKTWTGHLVKESIRMTEDTDKWRKCVSLAYDTGLPRPLYESSFWTWREVYETYDNHVRRRVVSNVTLNRRHSVSDSRQNVSAWSRLRYRGYSYGLVGRSRGQHIRLDLKSLVSDSVYVAQAKRLLLVFILCYIAVPRLISALQCFSVYRKTPKCPFLLGGLGPQLVRFQKLWSGGLVFGVGGWSVIWTADIQSSASNRCRVSNQ